MRTAALIAGTASPSTVAARLRTACGRGLLALVLALTAVAQAQFTYTTKSGTITITGYTGSGGAVTIPSAINGLPVTSIGGEAFANVTSLTSVLIPGSVTNIGDYGFAYCTSLRSVYFEGNVPTFGLVVFSLDPATAYYLAGTSGWGGVSATELTPISVTVSPTNGLEPLKVTFTSASADSAGNPISNWNWSFGDGSTTTDQNPSHTYTTYTNGATFWVALIERNNNGVPIAGAAMPITVSPLTAGFSANPTGGLEPLKVGFTSPLVDVGSNAITSWNWDFGDGATSTAQNPSHTYTSPGTFTAALLATNNLGLAVAASGPSITVSPLTVAFDANPTSARIPLTVSFNAAGVDNGSNAITSWNWNFGDGATSTAQNPSHTYTNGVYTNGATYLIALTATNDLGLAVIGEGPASVSALLPVPQYTNFNVLHTFTDYDGAYPDAGLILSGNTLYGTTERSLAPLNGTVFSLNNATLDFRDLVHFPNFNGTGIENYNGAYPKARLLLSGNTLYGTASYSAHFGYGDVFRFNTETSQFIVLHPFTVASYDADTGLYLNSDGIYPTAALVLADNTIYGTTQLGGSNGYGTVFSYNTVNSNFTTIHTFTGGNDGAFPRGDLIVLGDTLYGTAQQGGSSGYGTNGYGTVFSVSTSGAGFTSLYSFTGGADGAYPPPGGLLFWSNALYGTTAYGGRNGFGSGGYGTVFSLSTNGSSFTNLYSFTGGPDGAYPGAGLIVSGGKLYGVASGGGGAGNGTIYSLGLSTQDPHFAVLYSFTATNNARGTNSDGANPQHGLVLSGNLLYGTARSGGSNGYGTVFALPLPASATAPIPLTVRLEGGSLGLSWNDPASAFSLQSAPTITGVFTNIPSATGSYTSSITGAQQYFRLKANPP